MSPGTLIRCNPGFGLLMGKVIHRYALGSAKAQPHLWIHCAYKQTNFIA